MAELELINKSEYDFIDISSEEYREYHFIGTDVLRLEEPQWLAISKSGHRVLCKDGRSYFIANGWRYIEWKAKPGEPHFVR